MSWCRRDVFPQCSFSILLIPVPSCQYPPRETDVHNTKHGHFFGCAFPFAWSSLRENQGDVIHNYPQPFAQPECLKLAKLSCKVTKVLIKSFVLGSKSLLFFSPKTLKSLVFSQKTLKSLVLARHPPTPTHGYRLLSKIAYPSKNR